MKKFTFIILAIVLSVSITKAQDTSKTNCNLPPNSIVTYSTDTTIVYNPDTISPSINVPDSLFINTATGKIADVERGATGFLPIGFDFNFYGKCYSKFRIGVNGWISFAPRNKDFDSSQYARCAIPNTAIQVPKNAILWDWNDYVANSSPNFYFNYNTIGFAPNRKLVINIKILGPSTFYCFCGGQASCGVALQLMLHESSNNIDIYFKSKKGFSQNCVLTKTSKFSIMGVIDSTGSLATAAPNKNATIWPPLGGAILSNYAIRFTPEIITSIYSKNKKNISISPNPATNELKVDKVFKVESYKIYNLMGQTIEGLSPLKRAVGVCIIDISNLNKGIYIIELTTKEGIYRSKFVKE